MAKKKVYAVRKGHKTGLFETWAECQKATTGYSGAEFRGFTDREEAMAFLQMSTTANVSEDKDKEAAGIVEVRVKLGDFNEDGTALKGTII